MHGLLDDPSARWRQRLITFTIGMLGVAAALLLYHLWTDHLALHALIDYLNTNAAKINKLP